MTADIRLSQLIAPGFFPLWRAARESACDELWLYGGRGSGKSSFVALYIICGLMEEPGAALLDRALGQGNAMFRDAVCWFYIANEGLSLMENLNLAGVPFPQKLKELLGEKAEQGPGE